MNKKIEYIPYEKNMSLSDDCWFIIDVENQQTPKVIFFNPKQAQEQTTFKNFSIDYIEENFPYSVNNGGTITYDENECHAYGGVGEETEYDDPALMQEIPVFLGQSRTIDTYQNIPVNEIPLLIQQAQKKANSIALEIAYEEKNKEELRKNPYDFYGIRKSNFF